MALLKIKPKREKLEHAANSLTRLLDSFGVKYFCQAKEFKVEIFYLPIMNQRRLGPFGRINVDETEQKIDWMYHCGIISRGKQWGPVNKECHHIDTQVMVEFHKVDEGEMKALLNGHAQEAKA